MIKFSLPIIIGGSVLVVGATLGTVAVAMPGTPPSNMPTLTPEEAVALPNGAGDYIPAEGTSRSEVMPGLRIQDLPKGLSTKVTPTAVYFAYSGTCVDNSANSFATVWGNVPGMWSSRGSACGVRAVGQFLYTGASITWGDNVRNAWCNSKIDAYRFEIFGMTTEWVPIPESFKNCGPTPTLIPAQPLPTYSHTPPAPSQPEPTVTPLSTPAPTSSPSASSTSGSLSPTP